MRKSYATASPGQVATIADIASMTGCSDQTIRRWMRKPELGFPRPLFPPALSRTLLFDRNEVAAWLASQREQGRAP